MFSTLQQNDRHKRLPEDCTFEIEMSDSTVYACPDKLAGLEKRVCVFNGDFIEEHLRWHEGTANPVFTLSPEQGDAVAKLAKLEPGSSAEFAKISAAEKVLAAREKAFATYKREHARSISNLLRQTGRKYEAVQLADDHKNLTYDATSVLSSERLDSAKATCERVDAPQKVEPIALPATETFISINSAIELGPMSLGSIAVDGLDQHPMMVPWVKMGHDYHVSHGLSTCLYCGEQISKARLKNLSEAFDDKVTAFIGRLGTDAANAAKAVGSLNIAVASLHAAERLAMEFRSQYVEAETELRKELAQVTSTLKRAAEVLAARQSSPTIPIDTGLPSIAAVEELKKKLSVALTALNAVFAAHNKVADTFNTHQEDARLSIRRHFVADGAATYLGLENEQAEGVAAVEQARKDFAKLEAEIAGLKAKVQQHGPSAGKINDLVKAYLGHDEQTIVPVEKGYELHRHGKLATGAPSEGEKTAISLCYFLTTLEADGRKAKDLIVVVDDPISSLDTKSMHYACATILGRLDKVAQLFVMTHNQQCMNEIKRAWKGLARKAPEKPDPEARLLFIDVKLPVGETKRQAFLIEMPVLLRELDSEYQFAVQKALEFEAAGSGHFDYVLMMPNMLRRVLEIFLAFRVPRSGNIKDKLKEIGEAHPKLDKARLVALERLVQAESHSDSLDDLTGHSAMTIEESRDANAGLLKLMSEVDQAHVDGLRKYCKPN